MRRRKGILFTIDAVLGATLLLLGIFMYSLFFVTEEETTQSAYFSRDAVDFLAQVRMDELDFRFLHDLNRISLSIDPDISVLEQMALLWVKGEYEASQLLCNYTFLELIPEQYGFEIRVGNDVVCNRYKPGSETVITSKRSISGIEKSQQTERFLSYAHLTGMDNFLMDFYTYFQGFTGQGNITVLMEVPEFISIRNVIIEGSFSDNFEFHINGNGSGNFTTNRTNPLGAETFIIDPVHFSNFGGENRTSFSIRFNSSEGQLGYIGGGYIRVTANISANNTHLKEGMRQFTHIANDTLITRYYLPQVEGVINLYGSYYFPPDISNLSASLHYKSDIGQLDDVYLQLVLANQTIFFDENFTGEETIDLDPERFSALNLSKLAGKNVPMRFGWTDIAPYGGGGVDAILITDISGSMAWNITPGDGWLRTDGETWGNDCDNTKMYTSNRTMRLALAKCLDKRFVDIILEDLSPSRMGLVFFYHTLIPLYTNVVPLKDYTSRSYLHNKIDAIDNPVGNTCVSCGIYKAMELLFKPGTPIPAESQWKYTLEYPDAAPPGNWDALEYDDGSWPQGQMPIGFGPDSNTVIDPLYMGGDLMRDSVDVIPSYSLFSGESCWGDGSMLQNLDGNFLCLQNTSPSLNWVQMVGDVSQQANRLGIYDIETLVQDSNDMYKIPYYCGQLDDFRFFFNVVPGVWSDRVFVEFLVLRPFYDPGLKYEVKHSFRKRLTTYEAVGSPEVGNNSEYLGPPSARTFVPNGFPLTDIQEGDVLGLYTSFPPLKVRKPGTGRLLYESGYEDIIDDSQSQEMRQLTIGAKCNMSIRPTISTTFKSEPFTDIEEYDYIEAEINFMPEEDLWYDIFFFNTSDLEWVWACSGHVEATGEIFEEDCRLNVNPPSDFFNAESRISIKLDFIFDSYCRSGPCTAHQVKLDEIDFVGVESNGTIYLRKTFNVNQSQFADPTLRLRSDDRADMYINGQRIDGGWTPYPGLEWDEEINLFEDLFHPGENMISAIVYNQDASSLDFDAEIHFGDYPQDNKRRAMLVMSDGEANTCLPGGFGTCINGFSAGNETINLSCRAHDQYGIDVYTIGFALDPSRDPEAIDILNQSACCDNCSHFYSSQSAEELVQIYQEIAQELRGLEYISQSALIEGNIFSILYNDSYLEVNSTVPEAFTIKGQIPITVQSPRFGNNDTEFTASFGPNIHILDARLTSYSADRWTDLAWVYNQYGNHTIFDLSNFSMRYQLMGDPYIIEINPAYLAPGNNTFRIETAYSPTNRSGGSPDNSLIYTTLVSPNAMTEGLGGYFEGCNWTLQFEDLTNSSILVPSTYDGKHRCAYSALNHSEGNCVLYNDCSYDRNNSIDNAMHTLLERLDFDKDGLIDMDLDQASIQVETATVPDIPSLLGPEMLEVRLWQ
ncbi:MAG: hypothetical protein KJ709_00480 [Nanoarchaeota archaeon]|nr:hypothetical protein [Nanoarchaeota archaeon]